MHANLHECTVWLDRRHIFAETRAAEFLFFYLVTPGRSLHKSGESTASSSLKPASIQATELSWVRGQPIVWKAPAPDKNAPQSTPLCGEALSGG